MADWDPNKLLTKPRTGPTGSPPPDDQPVVNPPPVVNAQDESGLMDFINSDVGKAATAAQTGAAEWAPAGNNPPPPPRSPSEEQRYNSAARAYDTVVNANNPRGLGPSSKIRQSNRNVVAGSLQAKIEADRARGKTDPWTGWGTYHSRETRPILHSVKGRDGTTYYQQVDGKAGTARYWSVDSSGRKTEYTGDDKVSARDQINAARKNADLEARKDYWRSRGVQFGETDENGEPTGEFEKLTAEGARAEYERKFGDAERAIREGLVPEGMSVARAQRELDRGRFAWSKSGEGREQYNWSNKLDQSRKVDWDQEEKRYMDRFAAKDHAEAARQAHELLVEQGASKEAREAFARAELKRAATDRARARILARAAPAVERLAERRKGEAADRALEAFNKSIAIELDKPLVRRYNDIEDRED